MKHKIYSIETVANGYVVRDILVQTMPVESHDSTFVFETFDSMTSWLKRNIAKVEIADDNLRGVLTSR